MRTERFDGTKTRRLLSQLMWDDEMVSSLSRIFDDNKDLLRTPVENMFLNWCVQYYRKYGCAPKEDVRWILDDFSEERNYDELAAFVESLPRSLNLSTSAFDDLMAIADGVAIERLANRLLSRLSQGDIDGCMESIADFHRVSTGPSTGVNPFTDEQALIETFNDDSCKSLLEFRDWGEDAQLFFGDTFGRSTFVVFNAPEKGCKSTTLLEFAIQALQEGRTVAYFEAGDMSRTQVFRRMYQRVSHHPRRAGKIRYPSGEFRVSWCGDEGIQIHNDMREEVFDTDLTMDIARKGMKEWVTKYNAEDRFRFSDHPQTLTVPYICAILDEWERQDGFSPDFVIVDYADILQPVTKNEFRHQVNDTFSRLRALSLARKCCVITATQAKGGAYNSDTQSRVLISEDKRKAAHPTAMIGLASVQEEREQQVYHMNFILRRDDVCIESQKLYFAQCLAVCNPMVKCYFPENHIGERPKALEKEKKAVEEYTEVLASYGSDEFDDPWYADEKEPENEKNEEIQEKKKFFAFPAVKLVDDSA